MLIGTAIIPHLIFSVVVRGEGAASLEMELFFR
jgi:hypothetical protein